MQNLTVIVPYFNGEKTIERLVKSIPAEIPVIVVDDQSSNPVPSQLHKRKNLTIVRTKNKGYFSGACNAGMKLCATDVLILNQDAWLEGDEWQRAIAENRDEYAMIGERIAGAHPAFPNAYIHGTLMFIRRDAIAKTGELNAADYPLWGATAEYQLRLCRDGFKVLPLRPFPGLHHERPGRFGEAISEVLAKEPDKKSLFIRTPPEISVIVPCHNYGRYLPDLVNSLVGGQTSLGNMPQQSFASFEIILVDDASTDETPKICQWLANSWKGIHTIRLAKNVGTAAAINAGIRASHGKYLTIMGADDMRAAGSLEWLYRAQLEHPHEFIYDNIGAFADGKMRPDIKIGVRAFSAQDILKKNHIHAGIMFPRRAFVETGGYPEVMRDGREDWAMNVALTVHGWCGFFVDKIGYLYRREKQNRTLKNGTRVHWNLFKARIMALYPEYYDGRRDVMTCCGGGKSASKTPTKGAGGSPIPGGEGLVILRYVGGSEGKQTWYGPITGGQYPAGRSAPLVAVDPRDLHSKNPRTPGLLDIVEKGKKVFVQEPVKPNPPAAPVPVPASRQPSSEMAMMVKAEMGDDLGQPLLEVIPDPSALTLEQVKKLSFSADGWGKLAALENLGKKRKGVLAWCREQAEKTE